MKANLPYLKHILDEINFLTDKSEKLSFDGFLQDTVLKRASARSLEIIGEAVKNLSEDFKNKSPEIEWKKLAGLRDKIIHCYFDVNWDIVWDVMRSKLPGLKSKIELLIKECEE